MVNAHTPLPMSGEQFKHLANLFVTSKARNPKHAEVEIVKTLIDICDGSVPEKTREWIRELDEWQAEETGMEFLLDLVKKKT